MKRKVKSLESFLTDAAVERLLPEEAEAIENILDAEELFGRQERQATDRLLSELSLSLTFSLERDGVRISWGESGEPMPQTVEEIDKELDEMLSEAELRAHSAEK